MDEINESTLSEEIGRLHAEHRRYAQRLEELLQKPYLSTDEQLEEGLDMLGAALQEVAAAR